MDDPKIGVGQGEARPTVPVPSGDIKSRTLEGHTEVVSYASFSPDGLRAVSGSGDKTIRVWDIESGRELARHLIPSGYATCAAFAPDGERIVVGSTSASLNSQNGLHLIDSRSGEEVFRFDVVLGVNRAVYSPDGRFVATANSGWRPPLSLYDVSTGRETRRLEGEGRYVGDLVFSPDSRWILMTRRTAGTVAEGVVELWNAESGQEYEQLQGAKNAGFLVAAFSPDGKLAFAGGAKLALWSVDSGKRLWQVPGKKDRRGADYGIVGAAFTPDGSRILVGDHDSAVRVLDTTSGREIERFRESFFHRTRSMDFSPNRRRVLSSGFVRTARLWDLPK
jgi:dipeptidyl aminopeptidase/acylaminoacyl peptidase